MLVKTVIVIIFSIILLSACHDLDLDHDISANNDMTSITEKSSKVSDQIDKETDKMETIEKKIDKEEYERNKQMIINELNIDANSKKIDIIMSRYYELDNGLIKELSCGKEGVDECLYILTESGNEYRFYLSGTGVDSIYDIKNNDWPVKSIM